MPIDPARIPVLVGLGEAIERDALTTPVELAARAAEAAFAEAPGLREAVQRLSLVAVSFSPIGAAAATEIAHALSLQDVDCEATTPGGNTPQWLINRACSQIVAGELESTLIVGAEATRSMRLADPGRDFLRAATTVPEEEGPRDPVVGVSIRGMLSQAEIEAGLMRPADVYPVFENALSDRLGHDASQARARIAAFYARASEVASRNPLAWFPQPRSEAFIATPTPENRITAEPYTRCMNSFPNVDQGSALLLTTLARARAAGLEDQCIFPWSGANNADLVPVAREDLSTSPAIRAAAGAAFDAAGIGLDDVEVFDLYSCFPIAVEIGAAEIGLALDDSRGLTQTGFMSFFGGPGNNYTSHGIAAVARRLREGARVGYVSGNGGVLSKHSIGIYGSGPADRPFRLADTSADQEAITGSARPVVYAAEGAARVVSGTIVYGRDGLPSAAPIIAELPTGQRLCAKADEAIVGSLSERSLVGETVVVRGANPPVYTIGS